MNLGRSFVTPILCAHSFCSSRQSIRTHFVPASRLYSSHSVPTDPPSGEPSSNEVRDNRFSKETKPKPAQEQKKRSISDIDAEHLAKVHEAFGGGDMTNVEFENGAADRGMRRNVRENMFRII